MSFNILKHPKEIKEEFEAVRREIQFAKAIIKDEVNKLNKEAESNRRVFNNSITEQSVINANLTDQIQTIINTPDAPPPTEYYVPITGAYYFGDGLTEGDWRIIVDSTKLSFQRLESSVWTEKGRV